MSEADKKFEELGYFIDTENTRYIKFIDYNLGLEIRFNKITKEFIKVNSRNDEMYITMQELQAINLKCKELKWI